MYISYSVFPAQKLLQILNYATFILSLQSNMTSFLFFRLITPKPLTLQFVDQLWDPVRSRSLWFQILYIRDSFPRNDFKISVHDQYLRHRI